MRDTDESGRDGEMLDLACYKSFPPHFGRIWRREKEKERLVKSVQRNLGLDKRRKGSERRDE